MSTPHTPPRVTLSLEAATELTRQALLASGAGGEAAAVLALAAVEAEAQGYPGVGLCHVLDYCDGLEKGRIDGRAEPTVTRPGPAVFRVDGNQGIPHLGFQRVLEPLVQCAAEGGLALFLSHNAFTCAALGYFTQRLAERGLIALAATNGGPALTAGSGTSRAVFCTNPLSFAVPRGSEPPLVIDQSSSATAYVNIQEAARTGRTIPGGWALDAGGRPTTDAGDALRGTLLPFGGQRGANLALMVEILAAGLCGASWSLDAPSAFEGTRSPASGLFVLAIHPGLSGEGTVSRINAHLQRLAKDFGAYVPGNRRAEAARAARQTGIQVPAAVHSALLVYARAGH